MQTLNDVHRQFAEYFNVDSLKPYIYFASKRLSEGHICVPVDEVHKDREDLPVQYRDKIEDKDKLKKERLVSDGEEIQPFVLHKGNFYIHRYFNYETNILNRINQFLEEEQAQVEERKKLLELNEAFIKTLFSLKPEDPAASNTDWQLVAAVNAVLNNFTIITGGPGTGKTTTVAKILALLFTSNPNLKVALAAPTGKAAARMAESLGKAKFETDQTILDKIKKLEPSTLHRLLGYVFDSPNFKHNQDNPLKYDVVIIDESSMIDAALFAKLVMAIGKGTRLIMLGDKDQLASVEAGSMFSDLCSSLTYLNKFSMNRADFINGFFESEVQQIGSDNIGDSAAHPLAEHIIELRFSRRFVDEKGIGKFSKAVIQNDEQQISKLIEKQEKEVEVDVDYDEKKFEQFVIGYKDFIKEKDIRTALEKLNNLRVLCAVKEGEHGLYNINNRIERLLKEKNLITVDSEFYHNRPIMISRNYYDLELFNGDIGIIRRDGDVLRAYFPTADGVKHVPPGFVADSDTVYAMTIHKSQGSEFDKVLIILPDSADVAILTRELIYTGITRAKTAVLIQASEEVILESAKRQVKRASGIRERFLE